MYQHYKITVLSFHVGVKLLRTTAISLISLIVFLLLSLRLSAQLSPDSLKRFIEQPIQSEERFKVFATQCHIIIESQPEIGPKLWERMRQLADENESYLFELEYYRVKGIGYSVLFQFDSAMLYLKKALDLAIRHDSNASLAQVYINLGSLCANQSNYPLALEHYQKSLIHTDTVNSPNIHATILNHLGHLNRLLKEEELAEKYLLKAKAISEKHVSEKYTANIVNELANLYYDQGKIEKVLEMDKALAKTNRKIGNIRALSFNLNNIGEDYSALKQYDSALLYFNKSQALKKTLNADAYLISTYLNIAEVHQNRRKFSLAEIYYDSAYIYVQNSSLNNKKHYFQRRYNFEKNRGDLKEALANYQQFVTYKDSIFSKKNLDQINNLKESFESEKKAKQISEQKTLLAEQERRLQQNRMRQIGLAMFIGISLVAATVFYRQKKEINKQKIIGDKDRQVISEQAKKLKLLDATKSRFFANLSHDFRSPLTLLLGHLNELTQPESGYLSNKGESAVSRAQNNAQRLLSLTEEIRDLVVLEDNKLKLSYKKVAVVEWMDLLVIMFRSAAELKEVTLGFDHDIPEDFHCDLDPKQFEKVVFNLLSNAIKFTDPGDKITVSLSQIETGHLRLKVADTGHGINPQHLSMIFDRYYQSSDNAYRSVEGLGIGLALVSEIVALHQGEISATSNEGEGTTIQVDIPHQVDFEVEKFDVQVSEDMSRRKDFIQEDLAHVNHIQPLDASQEKLQTILIVDDYPQIRAYIASFLKDNYNVYFAANGQEALDRLKSLKIDLIITDLMMPVMDGFELIDHLRATHADLPVMVVSARTLESEKQKLLQQGVNDLLSKPFDSQELISRVRNHIANAEMRNVAIETLVDQKKDLQSDMLKKVNALLAERITESGISVADIADKIFASERQTYRLIKDLTGQTPLEYVRDYRLTYAEELLQKKDFQTTSELGQAVGINNVSRFNKLFKAKFGYLPADHINV